MRVTRGLGVVTIFAQSLKLETLNRPLATSDITYCSFISQNYGDPDQVRNCYLVGLNDLDGAQTYVQDVQAKYMNDLISIGVAGTYIVSRSILKSSFCLCVFLNSTYYV